MNNSKYVFFFVVVALFAGLGCWLAGGALVSPARATMPPTPANAIAVNFDSDSGSRIEGWFFSKSEAAATVVLMHGVRGNRTSLVARADFFQRMGFSVLTFDFQAHGQSPGDAITFGALESLDAVAAVQFARTQEPDLPVIVVGVSLGGASSVLAGRSLNADLLVIESVYSTIEQAVANRLNLRVPYSGVFSKVLLWQLGPRLGIAPGDLAPVVAAQNLVAPTLVLSGSDDRHTLLWETHALFKAIPKSKQLYIFDGASHQDLQLYAPRVYRSVVAGFICENLTLRICMQR